MGIAAGIPAAEPDFKAAVANTGQVRALTLEDRRGTRIVIAQAPFPMTQPVADWLGAHLAEDYGLERAAMLLHGAAGPGLPGLPARVRLEPAAPAVLRSAGAQLSVAAEDGRCVASVTAEGLSFENCGGGDRVRPPIRYAMQMIEPLKTLGRREEAVAPPYPVQAIAIGKTVTILALPGDRQMGTWEVPGLILVRLANSTAPPPADVRLSEAIRKVLSRVGR